MNASVESIKQKKAVQTLSKLKFKVYPDGHFAISTRIKNEDADSIRNSLKTLLGEERKGGEIQYSVGGTINEPDKIVARVWGVDATKTLAEAGVTDFAMALGEGKPAAQQNHR